jgi:zinc protease
MNMANPRLAALSMCMFVCSLTPTWASGASSLPIAPGIAQAGAAAVRAPTRVTTIDGITEYRLANGLRILMAPQAAKTTTAVDVVILAGTRQERVGQAGTAHLALRASGKSTPSVASVSEEFVRRGIRSTVKVHQDYAHASRAFRASDEQLEWLLKVEAERVAAAARFTQKDVDTETAAMLSEAADAEKKQSARLAADMGRLRSAWSRHGADDTRDRAELAAASLETVQAFYRTHYRPDNAVLMIAGKFDEAKTLAWIAGTFGAIAKPAAPLPSPTAGIAFAPADGKPVNESSILLRYALPPALHPDAVPIEFAAAVLFERGLNQKYKGISAGFTTEFSVAGGLQLFGSTLGLDPRPNDVRQAELAQFNKQLDERAVTSADERKKALDGFYANTRLKQYAATEAELIERVEGLAGNPPTTVEMDRVRERFASAARQALDNHEKLGEQLAGYIGLGDWQLFFYQRDRVKQLTANDIAGAAGRHFRSENRIASFARVEARAASPIAAAPTAAELLQSYKPSGSVAAAPAPAATTGAASAGAASVGAFNPDTTALDQRVRKIEIGGLVVSLLQKPDVSQTVAINVLLQSGDEQSLVSKAGVASMVARMLENGTSRHQFGIADERSSLRMRGDFGNRSANFQTARPYIAGAIRLIGHTLREPTFPEAALRTTASRMQGELRASKSSASRVVANAMQQHFNAFPPGDFRNARSFEEQERDLTALTLTDLRSFHQQFYGASKGHIAIVGDFDEAEVVAALREAFDGWNTSAAYARLARPYKDIAASARTIELPNNETAAFAAGLPLNLQDSDPDYAALLVADYLVGSAPALQSRLTARLRLQEGACQAVRSELVASSSDRSSMWRVYAYADAAQMQKLEAAFKDEIARVQRSGFSSSEVATARAAVLRLHRERRTRDNVLAGGEISADGLAGQLVRNSQLGRTFAWNKQLDDRIAALRVEDVNAAFRKHIALSKISVFKAGDFARVASAATKK